MKHFFQSKTIWIGIVTFVLAVLSHIFRVDVPAGTAQQIVNQDWTNIVQALFAVGLILVRVFDSPNKPIRLPWARKLPNSTWM